MCQNEMSHNLHSKEKKKFSYLLQRQRVINRSYIVYKMDRLPTWFSDKESTCQVGDEGLIPGSRRCPGEGNGNPLQYYYLQNPMDRGAWRATVYGVIKELGRTQQLNNSNKFDTRGVHSSSGLEAFNLKKCFCYKPEAWSCLAPGEIYFHFTILE